MKSASLTEGLVKQCSTDRELTAVLASELGKIVAERVATAGKDVTNPEVPGPVDLPIGGHGYASDADPSHYVEMAKFEKTNPRRRASAHRRTRRLAACRRGDGHHCAPRA